MNRVNNVKGIGRKSRAKRLCAVIMSLVLCLQMISWNELSVKAAVIRVEGNYEVTEDMGSENSIQIEGSGTLTNLGYTIAAPINIDAYGSSYSISNTGTISGEIWIQGGECYAANMFLGDEQEGHMEYLGAQANVTTSLNISCGTFGTVNVREIGSFGVAEDCTVRSLSSRTNMEVSPYATLTVTDSLTLTSGVSNEGKIQVSDTTLINTDSALTVTCITDGENYEIPAGFNGTIAGAYKSVTVIPGDGMTLETEGIAGTYWIGETTGTNTYKVLPGYAFDVTYISNITTSGAGVVDATVNGQELTIKYTLSASETSDITINLPDARVLSPGTVVFTIPDIYIGQEVSYTFGGATVYDTATATIEYKKSSEGDGAYTTAKPTAVGDYIARVSFPATYDYGAYSKTYNFSIKELEEGLAEITVADISYGETLNPQYVSSTNATTPIVEYKLESDADTAYSTTVPTAVGSYNARVTFPATPTHTEAVATTSFKINRLPGGGSVSVEDVYVGTEIQTLYSSDKNGTEGVVVEYRLISDAVYTTEKPTAVGSYEVRATFPETLIYSEFVATDTFEIKDLENGVAGITVNDVFFGDSVTPVVESSTNAATPIVEYKLESDADTAYSTTVPTAVGSYNARVTFPATSTHTEAVATTAFKIKHLPGGGSVSVEDIYVGTEIQTLYSSDKNGTEDVVVEYRLIGDAVYTTEKPTAVGSYEVRATFPETLIYSEFVATDDFSIKYLEAPEDPYTVSGTMGENDIYTSEVTVTAKEGYLISDSFGGVYVGKLVFDTTTADGTIYLKKIQTGEMTAGIDLKGFEVDMDAPVLSLEDGKTYYEDSVVVALSDDIVKIVLNDETITGEDLESLNKTLALKSEGGTTKYSVQVWDKAGNTTKKEVTVASKWTKSGKIPAGNKVKLSAGKEYSFAEGTWQVEGDTTNYVGNITFYVSKAGNYTFTKK